MEDFLRPDLEKRHFNLFYTYHTNHLEDNVTRALMLTLRSLAPVHLRLFLRDVILKNPAQESLRSRMQVFTDSNFDFDLQVTSPSKPDRLDLKNGVIVGVKYSGTVPLNFAQLIDKTGGSRPDPLLSDKTNEIAAIFETKLSDSLYQEQIERHFQAFFNTQGISVEQIYIEITWTEIADFLQRIARQSVSQKEQFMALEFVQYLDWLKLLGFLGFNASDFSHQQDSSFYDRKLDNFLAQMVSARGNKLSLKEYDRNYMLHYHDVLYENVWAEMGESGVSLGIVDGSGKMWRAKQLRDFIITQPNEIRMMLDRLRNSIDPNCLITLRVHSYFRHSRFRTAWLGDIDGVKIYPTDFDDFVACLTDARTNVFDKVSKVEIQNRFLDDIKANLELGRIKVDSQGGFPQWEDIESFLQYSYFHIDVRIPSTQLINRNCEDLFKSFETVLEAEHQMMLALTRIGGNSLT